MLYPCPTSTSNSGFSRSRPRCLLAWLLLATTCGPATALGGGLLKWVDEQGGVHYGDKLPPDQSDRRADLLNRQGVTIDTIDPTASLKEHDSAKAPDPEAAARAERSKQMAQEAAHDRLLLKRFGSAAALAQVRDRRLAGLDAEMGVTQAHIEKLKEQLANITASAARQERGGVPIAGKVDQDMAMTQQQLQEHLAVLDQQRQHRLDLKAEYDADLQRLRQLEARAAAAPAP